MRNKILRLVFIISVLFTFFSCYEIPSQDDLISNSYDDWHRTNWNDLVNFESNYDTYLVDSYEKDGAVYVLLTDSYSNYQSTKNFSIVIYNQDDFVVIPEFESSANFDKILVNSQREVFLINLGTNIVYKYSNGNLINITPSTYYSNSNEYSAYNLEINQIYIDNSDNIWILDDYLGFFSCSTLSNTLIMERLSLKDFTGNSLQPTDIALINDKIAFKVYNDNFIYFPKSSYYEKSIWDVYEWPEFITFENYTYFLYANTVKKVDLSTNQSAVNVPVSLDDTQVITRINVDNDGNLFVFSTDFLYHYDGSEWIDYTDFLILSNSQIASIKGVYDSESGNVVVITSNAVFVKKI